MERVRTEGTHSAHDLFAKHALSAIRSEIGNAGQNEVFFRGKVDEHLLVTDVEVCARGNEDSVPVFFQTVEPGEVVIHNHPSGDLVPSDADTSLAAEFAQMSVGSYVIDNNAEQIYVIIPPFEKTEEKPLDAAECAAVIERGSRLARLLTGYEYRQEQVWMMGAVVDAFNNKEIALIEAATGTGKTVAYLVPAILWSTRNKGRTVVSTNTINLQEQLIWKDIPLLKQAMNLKFKAVLVKGRGNYGCLRKLKRVEEELGLLPGSEDAELLSAIVEWSKKTRDGSKSDLSFVPPERVWERVASEADVCMHAKCPHFRACFVNRARREAAKADVLVVNHHLLFADLALRIELGKYSSLAVLPPYQRIIFDEGHNVEDVATSYFGRQVTRIGVERQIGRISRLERTTRGEAERGIVPFLRVKLMSHTDKLDDSWFDRFCKLTDEQLLPARDELILESSLAFDEIFRYVRSILGEDGPERKLRVTASVRDAEQMRTLFETTIKPFAGKLRRFASDLFDVLRLLKEVSDESCRSEIASEIVELRACPDKFLTLAGYIEEFFGESGDEEKVYWIELGSTSRKVIRLKSCPLDISGLMAEHVYPNFDTIVMTSATLAVDGSLGFLRNRLGLNDTQDKTLSERVLASPFDYESQAIVAIPTNIPLPNDAGFLDAVSRMVLKTVETSHGRAFVLFTSFRALEDVHAKTARQLRELGFTPLKQGSRTRHALLAEFRRDIDSVLFGTDSFWQGVDVEGEALECVILVKLPFKVPTEPVQEARAERIDRLGGNSFLEYTVPQAVIKFRQGLGRLIRRKTDRGAIVVLDKRVLTRPYGRTFLSSIPPARTVKGTSDEVVKELRSFFTATLRSGTSEKTE